jgi:hypothetical protein
VIASLVYLATQIRHSREQMSQNTRALRAGAYQESHHQMSLTMQPLALDPEMARSVQRGMADLEQLPEEDVFRFGVWISGVLVAFENSHYQHRLGLLDDDRWEQYDIRLRAVMSPPGCAHWWRTSEMTASSSPDFTALVEEILGDMEPDRGE